MNEKVADLCKTLVENALELCDRHAIERAQEALEAAEAIAVGTNLDRQSRQRAFEPLAMRLCDVTRKLILDGQDAREVMTAVFALRGLIDAGPELFE